MEEMNTSGVELSLEQQFNIRSFETQVEQMSLEQAHHVLKELYRQMIVREKMYQELLKKEWNLESNPFINRDED